MILTTYEYKCPYCGSNGKHTTGENILYCPICNAVLSEDNFTIYHKEEVQEYMFEIWGL
jgi:ribosomal protein L37AE/L43A